MEYYILGLAIVLIVGSILLSRHFFKKYKKVLLEYHTLEKTVEKSYIKADVRVYNAIYEAYEQAIEKDNNFEARIFSNLLQEIKGKW